MMFRNLAKNLICASAMGVLAMILAMPGWCQCSTCGSMQGIEVNEREGTVAVLPVVAGVDVGRGAPGVCDASNLPGNGNVRNLGTANSPNIKWGASRITLDGSGYVLMDGVRVAGWSWNSSTKTLTAPQGYVYVFNSAMGMLTSASGPNGMFVTAYTYHATYPDCITQVTDSLGNVWTYGVDISKPGPDYVINPDGTRKVGYTYKAVGANGAGQYDTITVYKWSGSAWVEQEHTSYTYNSDKKITQVSTADADDAQNPSTTNIQYVNGSEGGRTNPVRRIYNSKLKMDTCYEYGTESIAETYEGSKTYGYTQVRRRATCSSASSYSGDDNSNSYDQVRRAYYYQTDSKNDFVYKTVQVVSDGSGGLQAYSAIKYLVYGYLTRFSASPPTYDDVLKGKPWKIVDARGNATIYTYSTANGQVTRIDVLTGDYTQTQISEAGYVEKVRDSRGKYTRLTRDATYPSLVTRVEVSDSADSGYSTVREISYYSSPSQKAGLPYQVTVPDIEGNDDMVTTYDYSETIDSTTYYRPIPTTTTYSRWNGSTYESMSRAASCYSDGRTRWTKDALNYQTDYSYNNELQLVRVFYPADSADSGIVDSSTSTTMADSSQTWYADQLAGMGLEITSGTYIGNSYRVSSNTDTVITTSDTLPGDLGTPTYRVRPFDEISYRSCCGSVEKERDSRGNSIYYGYGDGNRLTQIRNDDTTSVSTYPLMKHTYNDLGEVTEVRTYKDSDDSTGRPVVYAYDQVGRVKQITYPDDGGTRLLWDEHYQRDASGNTIAKLVGTLDNGEADEGEVTVYEYDSLDRLTKVKYDYYNGVGKSNRDWPIANISISNEDVSYQYDGGSGLTSQMVDSSGTSSYTYDARGQLSTYTPPLPANYKVEYTYNPKGMKTSVVVKYNNSGWVNEYKTAYAYLKNGWLKQVKGQKWNSGTSAWTDVTQVDFEYDAAGNQTKRKNNGSGDLETTYDLNARREIRSITHNKSGDLYKLMYTRDGLDNPLQVAFSGSQFSKAYTNGDKVRYEYDALSRLTDEDWGHLSGGSWVSDGASSWDYDWVGNRDPSSNDYNQADMLNKDDGCMYDHRGNVEYEPDDTQYARTRFYYDAENLLNRVDDVIDQQTTNTTDITWDAHKQRLKLAREGDTWEMIYDATAGIPAVLLAKNYVSSSTTYMYNVRKPNGELLCSFDASETPYYYHFDALGSTVLVTDSSGSATDNLTYGAWGDILNTPPNDQKPYQFVGELGYYAHSSTQGTALGDLMQLGVRYYDTETARFTQLDGAKDGWNWYGYARANSLVNVDPSGYVCYRCWREIGGWGGEYHSFLWCDTGKKGYDPKDPVIGFGPGDNDKCSDFDRKYMKDKSVGDAYGLRCNGLSDKLTDCLIKRVKKDMGTRCYGNWNLIWNNCQEYTDDMIQDCKREAGIK